MYIQINITPPDFVLEDRNWIPGKKGNYSLQLYPLMFHNEFMRTAIKVTQFHVRKHK